MSKRSKIASVFAAASVMTCGFALALPATAADTTNLTIVKYQQPSKPGTAGDGSKIDPSTFGTKPLQGIKFKLYRVKSTELDKAANTTDACAGDKFFTNAGIQDMNAAMAGFNSNDDANNPGKFKDGKFTFDTAVETPATAADGTTKFGTSNKCGLYRVVEVTPSDPALDTVEPFWVTLPMKNPKTGALNRDVYVYPKDFNKEINKVVEDGPTVKVGDDVKFTIETAIPRSTKENDANGEGKTELYAIRDQLDDKLTYKSMTIKVGSDSNTVTLASPADYTIGKGTGDNSAATSNLVIAKFTEQGRTKILQQKIKDNNAKVFTEITATVKTVGIIENKALLFVNKGNPDDGTGGNESPKVVTKYGGKQFIKVDEGKKPLPGAKFKLYVSNTKGQCSASDTLVNDSTNLKWTGGTYANGEFTLTASDGNFSVDGLRYSEFSRNTTATGNTYKQYCLVETAAPAGYTSLEEPIKFIIDSPLANSATSKIEIVNTKIPGGFLPMTGAQGFMLCTVLGSTLVLGGAGIMGYSYAKRRRENA